MLEFEHDTTPDSEQPGHEHEHGEEEHAHEHVPGEGVVAAQRGCGAKCRQCLGCQRRETEGELDFLKQNTMNDFLEKLFQNLTSIGIDLTGLSIDHIAYRASTIEEGDQLKQDWMQDGVLVKAAQVNGREVSVFQLSNPLEFQGFQIPCTELMYPKPSKPYGGWDHVEVVLGSYTPSIDVFRERLLEWFPDIADNAGDTYSYEEDGFHTENGQVLNPNITIRFTDKTAVRFHTADIREIIEVEG